MATAWGYCRVSTQQQVNEGCSLEHQQQAIDDYYRKVLAGTSPPVEWGGTFVDRMAPGGVAKGCSGKTPIALRPAGGELLKRVQPGDHVIMLDLTRGFRNFVDAIVTVEGWMAKKIAFHAIRRQIDTSTPGGKLIFRVLAMAADMEREMISERTREVLAWRKAQGLKCGGGGHAPPGKKFIGKKGNRRLVDDPEEMAQIDQIVRLREEEGMTYEQIYFNFLHSGILSKWGRAWSVPRIWKAYKDRRGSSPEQSQSTATAGHSG